MRLSNRNFAETREITIETNVNCHAEGSCIINFGQTKILCTASFETEIPRFLRGKNQGWLTATYSSYLAPPIAELIGSQALVKLVDAPRKYKD